MASKNNQQRNDEGNRLSSVGTTLSNKSLKELQSSPNFQRKPEYDALSSSSQSNNDSKKNKSSKSSKLSKSSSTRSNSSDKQSKSSPAKTNKSNSVNRISRGKATLSSESMKELRNSKLFRSQQSLNNTSSPKTSDRAPQKKSKITKALSKFASMIKRPIKTGKSSLGMNNNEKTTSHVDKLRNQRNNTKDIKPTRGR